MVADYVFGVSILDSAIRKLKNRMVQGIFLLFLMTNLHPRTRSTGIFFLKR